MGRCKRSPNTGCIRRSRWGKERYVAHLPRVPGQAYGPELGRFAFEHQARAALDAWVAEQRKAS